MIQLLITQRKHKKYFVYKHVCIHIQNSHNYTVCSIVHVIDFNSYSSTNTVLNDKVETCMCMQEDQDKATLTSQEQVCQGSVPTRCAQILVCYHTNISVHSTHYQVSIYPYKHSSLQLKQSLKKGNKLMEISGFYSLLLSRSSSWEQRQEFPNV